MQNQERSFIVPSPGLDDGQIQYRCKRSADVTANRPLVSSTNLHFPLLILQFSIRATHCFNPSNSLRARSTSRRGTRGRRMQMNAVSHAERVREKASWRLPQARPCAWV